MEALECLTHTRFARLGTPGGTLPHAEALNCFVTYIMVKHFLYCTKQVHTVSLPRIAICNINDCHQ